jgi:hypothetical protein
MFHVERIRLLLIFTAITGVLFPLSQYPTPIGKWKYLENGGQIKWIYQFDAYLSGKFTLYKGSVSIPDNRLPAVIKGKFRMSGLNIHCKLESGDEALYDNSEWTIIMNLTVNPISIMDNKGRKFTFLRG